MSDEQRLAGGNVSDAVMRVGATVRKPWTNATPSVFEYMTTLREAGIDLPAVFGRDEQGRQVIEFIPGQLALESKPLTRSELSRVGAIVRAIHDASETFRPAGETSWETAIPAPGADLVCHNDLAPWNLIIGERWVFIDWDAAAPSTRLWDLAYAAQAFTLSDTGHAPKDAARNLTAFIEGYGADHDLRVALPAAMHRRAAAMLDLLASSSKTGREPWASMYPDGHGDHWRAATEYVNRYLDTWSEALLAPAR